MNKREEASPTQDCQTGTDPTRERGQPYSAWNTFSTKDLDIVPSETKDYLSPE